MSLVEFKDLGDSILLYEPRHKLGGGSHDPQEYVEPRPGSPGLIILCTWLGGATSKRIERYTQRYHSTWPTSSILLIRTNLNDFLARSGKCLRRRLRPAYREIRRIALDPYSTSEERSIDGGILLHIMSQGGTNMATHLITSLNRILGFVGRDVPLPLRQIVLDSCPGDPDIKSTHAAGVHSLPRGHPLVQPLGCAVMYVIAASIAGLEATGLRKPTARIMRRQLNDPDIFPPGAARLYLTSRADKIVDFRQVEAHAEQAASEGLKTEIVVFDRAGHCCLMLEDDIAYWNAIVSCWERSGPPKMAETPREGMVEGAHSHQDPLRVRLNEGRSRL